MTGRGWQPDTCAVRRVFDRVAPQYSEASFVAREIATRLGARLDLLAIEPAEVVDMGAGTGDFLRTLYKRYPAAAVTGVDLSLPMLRQADGRRSLFRRARLVQADARSLPFADESLDLVTAGLLLFLLPDMSAFFREINRVLKPSGTILFSTLGPDSLRSVFDALQTLMPDNTYLAFPDMHDVGDAMLAAGLAQPVLDTEFLNVDFSSSDMLLDELAACGGINVAAGRRRGLVGAGVSRALRHSLAGEAGARAVLEIIQGHAWKGGAAGLRGVANSPLPDRVIPLKPEF